MAVGNAGRCLHTQQQCQFRLRCAVVVKPVLAEQREVADPGRGAEDIDRTYGRSTTARMYMRGLTQLALIVTSAVSP